MKSRVPILVAAIAAVLLAAPRLEAGRTAPQLPAAQTGQLSATDLAIAALDRFGAVSRSPQRLTFLSRRERVLIPALALLSAQDRTELLGSRSLGLGRLNDRDRARLQGYENRILLWTPDDPGEYLPAQYTLTVNLQLTDPAGHPIHGPPTGLTYLHLSQSDIVWSNPPETPLLTASAVGNDRYLHGRPYLPDLALYDHRARFYEPATSTFLEPDPLGPVDSPNPYQAFGFDPLNVRDPSGMGGPFGDHLASQLAIRRSDLDEATKQELLRAQNEAEGRAVTTILRQIGIAQDWVEEQIVEHTPLDEVDISFLEVYTATNPEAVGNAARGLAAGVGKARTFLRENKAARKLVGLFKNGTAVENDAKAATYRPGDLLPNGTLAGDGPGAMLRQTPALRNGGNAVVLGQNMEHRVIPAAKKLSAGYLKTPASEWTWAKNRAFLYRNIKRVREGSGRIFDIGWQRGRYHGPRAIYSREAEYLRKHGLERVFTGKWITASNGRRFRLYEWRPKQ